MNELFKKWAMMVFFYTKNFYTKTKQKKTVIGYFIWFGNTDRRKNSDCGRWIMLSHNLLDGYVLFSFLHIGWKEEVYLQTTLPSIPTKEKQQTRKLAVISNHWNECKNNALFHSMDVHKKKV